MSEMRVVGVRVELPATNRSCCCARPRPSRDLPIWIGSVEATAIALEQQGVRPPRPLTHDLLKEIITALGRELEQVLRPLVRLAFDQLSIWHRRYLWVSER